MPGIADLPVELFVDDIFAYLPVRDLLNFGAINRFFNSLVNDEALWHQRIEQDFNFSGADTARHSGWKFLYKRLSNPAVYVWGEKSAGRLGIEDPPRSGVRDGVPYPVRLNIPGAKIVSLVAGGMSFHAIDSRGDIYVWGMLDGTSIALRSDGFSDPCKKAEHPVRLKLPMKFRSLSCGRLHTTAIDAASQIWTFVSWGRPFRLSSALIDKSSPETTPIQVESGWSFSSLLTQSGDVLVYWPNGGRLKEIIDQKAEELDKLDNEELKAAAKARPTEAEPNVVPCYWWVLHGADPVRLPPIPSGSLPALPHTGLTQEALDEETKLVKIAALDNNIIGLTNKGHVLRYGELYGEDEYQQGRWEYLPLFSDVQQIKNKFASTTSDNSSPGYSPPDSMLITHISASFETFFAYSVGKTSAVLMGKGIPAQSAHVPHPDPFTNDFAPTIIPELQNRSVISVVLGDYHYGALTATGKLLTWGQFSKGALGLGDPLEIEVGQPGGFPSEQARNQAVRPRYGLIRTPPDVQVPTEVRFDHGEKRKRVKYCFAAAALGWHTGALVIDLDPDQEEEEEEEEHVTDAFPANQDGGGAEQEEPPAPGDTMAHFMPIGFGRGRGMHPFRVGFAGRGMHRGGPPAGN
ncbi:RCC1/BLIP-II [Dichomitus squalens]|uniref:RCC1/BLIP-II n=1 Tax=Dichomitus squalens TaxID=114155 RepID=A0A4Q9PTA0_9APHY|nr:RCC1/BLIP-II [Dichomitus squalens]TBU57676.1 RCC1/BLIP-II [Dichomitus squalens]